MKIVYLGTPDFAVKPLEAIVKSKHEVLAVVTQPDKPVGRKAIITPCDVKVKAQEFNLKTLSYDKIKLQGVNDLKALNPDIMVTCAFGQILSQEILDIAKHGVINIHASLLPKYRGSAPIQYAVINGEEKTGVTIMQTELGVDTGDIIMQKSIDVLPDETAGELFDRLSDLGAEIIVSALDSIENGSAKKIKQNHDLATHVKMISKKDGVIDFTKTALEVKNFVRGMNPWPVAYTYFEDKMLKIYSVEISSKSGKAGEVISSSGEIIVGCGENSVKLLTVQLEGGKKMTAEEFLRGHKIFKGYTFKCL